MQNPADRLPPLSRSPRGLQDRPPANDAVAHFSELARGFDGHYQHSPDFHQRQALWNRLIDAHVVPTGLTLDVGCGSGDFTFHAARKGGRVIGIDGASEMIALAEKRRRAESLSNVEFVQSRLPDLDEKRLGGARLIICSSVLEYVEDLDGALARLAGLLKRGGTLLVSMPNLLSINRIYHRLSHRLTRRSSTYRHIRHFTLPGLLGLRVERLGLDLREVAYYDHHTLLARLTRKLRLPEPLTEDLFVAVFRKG